MSFFNPWGRTSPITVGNNDDENNDDDNNNNEKEEQQGDNDTPPTLVSDDDFVSDDDDDKSDSENKPKVVSDKSDSDEDDDRDSLDNILDEVEIESAMLEGKEEDQVNNNEKKKSAENGRSEGFFDDMPALCSGSESSDESSHSSSSDTSDSQNTSDMDDNDDNDDNENYNNNDDDNEGADPMMSVPIHTLNQLQTHLRGLVRDNIASPNNVNGNAYSVSSAIFDNDMERMQDLLLESSTLSNQMSNRMVTESRRYRQNQDGREVTEVQDESSDRFVRDLRRYSRAISLLADRVETHVQNEREEREMEEQERNENEARNRGSRRRRRGRRGRGGNDGANENPISGIANVLRNVFNRTMNGNNDNNDNNNNNDNNAVQRRERTTDERVAGINLNTSATNEAVNLVHMAISQNSSITIFDLLNSVVDFTLPKLNDRAFHSTRIDRLMKNVLSHNVGNQLIFIHIFHVIAELSKIITIQDLIRLKRFTNDRVNEADIYKSLERLESYEEVVSHAGMRHDFSVLKSQALNDYFNSKQMGQEEYTWAYVIDNLYTLVSPDIGLNLHNDLKAHSEILIEEFNPRIRSLMYQFILIFSPLNDSFTNGMPLPLRIGYFMKDVQQNVAEGCINMQVYGLDLPLQRICRLVLEQFFRSVPSFDDEHSFTSQDAASTLGKELAPFFAPMFEEKAMHRNKARRKSGSNRKSLPPDVD